MSKSSTVSSVGRFDPKHQASAPGATADDDDVDGVGNVVASLETKLRVSSNNGKQSVHKDETPAATPADSEAELEELCTAVAQLYPQVRPLLHEVSPGLRPAAAHMCTTADVMILAMPCAQPMAQQHGALLPTALHAQQNHTLSCAMSTYQPMLHLIISHLQSHSIHANGLSRRSSS
jgi:hypothetical protein